MAVLKHAGIAGLSPDLPDPEVVSSVARGAGVLSLLTRRDVPQGDSVLLPTVTASVGGATFDEDDAVSADAVTISSGSFDMEEFIAAYGFSGTALVRAGGNSDLAVDITIDDAYASLVSTIENWTCSSKSIEKLIGQIDDLTTNWGGLDRSSVTALVSNVIAGGSATISDDLLYQVIEGMEGGTFMGNADVWLMSPTQSQLFMRNVPASPAPTMGGQVDAGYSRAFFAERPILKSRGMLNSVVLALTGVRGSVRGNVPMLFWYNFQPDSYFEGVGGFEAQSGTFPLVVGADSYAIGNIARVSMGITNDSVSQYLKTAGALVVRQPAAQGMVEALATS